MPVPEGEAPSRVVRRDHLLAAEAAIVRQAVAVRPGRVPGHRDRVPVRPFRVLDPRDRVPVRPFQVRDLRGRVRVRPFQDRVRRRRSLTFRNGPFEPKVASEMRASRQHRVNRCIQHLVRRPKFPSREIPKPLGKKQQDLHLAEVFSPVSLRSWVRRCSLWDSLFPVGANENASMRLGRLAKPTQTSRLRRIPLTYVGNSNGR